ncbi:MAG: hypothetical protein ACYDIA_09575 [Candidatus Humimicrobiaceae bacterium]
MNTKRLGDNPLKNEEALSWITNTKKEDRGIQKVDRRKIKRTKYPADKYDKATFLINKELMTKVRDYSYWERKDITKIINEILEEYFKDKKVKTVIREVL